jgi:hypothetical protein
MRDGEDAGQVDVDGTPPVRGGRVAERDHLHQAGVVHQQIQIPEALLHCGGRLSHGVRVGDIGRYDERRTAGLGDLGGDLLEPVAAPSQQCDRGAVGGEAGCDGGADPAGGAGDKGDA